MADPSQFYPIMLGSGLGVVAGVAVQYGFQMVRDWRQRSLVLADVRAEAVYNTGIVENIIAEAGKLRACCNPGALPAYFGVFRFNDVLWIAINRMVQSGQLYRTFNHQQIEKIQQCMIFLSMQTYQFAANKVQEFKTQQDYKGGVSFANYIESECRKHLDTIRLLRTKH